MAPGFSIELDFVGGLNDDQRKVFELAAKRWEEVIQGTASGEAVTLTIKAEGQTIDGPGRVLGQAGPTRIRSADGLPVQGVMQFDAADLADMGRAGTLKSIILHEMAHVLGIGTLWQSKGVLTGAGTANPEYTGAKAMREYATLLKESSPKRIPVANTGGPGTAEGHWREITFDYELMTGYAEEGGTEMPLSRMTVAAMEDLGYAVKYEAADDYALPLRPAVVGTAEVPSPRANHYCTTTFPKIETEKKKWCCCCF